MTLYTFCAISLGVLALLVFIAIALNYWRSLLFGVSLTDPALCPYCRRCEGEKSGDELMGRFQKTERRYKLSGWERSPGNIIWYEKHKIQYKCKQCGREWDFLAVIKQ